MGAAAVAGGAGDGGAPQLRVWCLQQGHRDAAAHQGRPSVYFMLAMGEQ